jgi:glycosyltransferase involved in cell wall biosynthesis
MSGQSRLTRDGLVSCVVPVYNGERFLADAVQTITDQTHRPLEILLCDDGSTDRTAEVAAALAADRSEPAVAIRILGQQNAGASAARNHGAREASGELLAFLDVDDLWLPKKLAIQVEVLAGGEADVSVTWMQNVWLDEVAEEGERYREHGIAQPMVGYLTQTMVLSRAHFERIGTFREDLQHSGDTEWMARAKNLGALIHVTPEVLVHRRLHRDNMSRSTAQKTDEYLDLARALIARGRTTP